MAFNEYLINKRGRLTWCDEAAFGDGGDMANNGILVGVNAMIEPDFDENWQEILTAGADARTVENKVVGPLTLPFTLSFTMVEWKFLKYLGYSFTNTGGPTYTHTGTLQNAVQSFAIEWAFRHTTSVVISLVGCFAKGGTISFQKSTGEGTESFVKVTMQCMAQDYTLGSSVTSVSATTRTPYQFRMIKATLDNVETVEVNNGDITIDQGINEDDSRYANNTLNRKIGEPIPLTHRITGRFNVNHKASTHFDSWATDAAISNCSLDFIENSSTNKLELDFSGFRFHKVFPSMDNTSVTNSDLVWSALSFSGIVATDTLGDY